MAINPRKILGLEVPVVKKGTKANLTLFDPALNWEFETKDNASKSKNSPFFGKTLTGKAIGVINNNRMSV